MRKFSFLFVCLLFVFAQARSQENIKVYPTNWWVGMKNPKLQLLIRGKGVGDDKVSIAWNGIKVEKVSSFKNPDYLAIDLLISAATKPGDVPIVLKDAGGSKTLKYALQKRNPQNGKSRIRGIDAGDFIYLIMPDRFSNGEVSNDKLPGFRDKTFSRDSMYYRHGGDLQGVIKHLDYLQDLGVTALWLNPVLENDMMKTSYHGYAATDLYQVDERLGGNKAYHELSEKLHSRGMKLIQDAVYNHFGLEHFLFRDLPDSSWFHFWPTYTNTTYKDQVLMDPYASQWDAKRMSDGWFVPSMPDVNQKNPFMANYLIQNAIWCTEEFGVDGWRIDTYAYNDLDFMNRCNAALFNEYPQMHIFGETWVHGVPNQSFFTANNVNGLKYSSNMSGATDFQLNLYGIVPALNQPNGWTEGINRLYLTASQDFMYKDPMKNVIFLDNHDISRFLSQVGDNTAKLKIGIGWLLTFRGIPQFYYGTEILMKNFANPDGLVRMDFPGGWPDDTVNKFVASGRSGVENEIFNFTRTLANFRKTSPAITKGKMMQFVPQESVYVYFRYTEGQTIMCVLNNEEKEREIDLSRFAEMTSGFRTAYSITEKDSRNLQGTWKIAPMSFNVYELKK